MKIHQYILSLFLFILPCVNASADEAKFDPKVEQVLVDSLGKELINSICKKDKEAFLKCWVTTEGIITYMKTLPEGLQVPQEQMGKFRQYFDNTRTVVSANFDLIQKSLKDQGIKASEIVFSKVEVKYDINNGIRMITSADVTFKHEGSEYVLDIDDALKIDGTWRFSDKPNRSVRKSTQNNKKNKAQ